MIPLDKQQIYRLLFWLTITIFLAVPLEVLHLFLALLHILFEWTEEGLDFVVEVVFGTSLHSTQIIVFYIFAIVFLFGCYRAKRGFPAFYQRQKVNFREFLSYEIDTTIAYWHESVANKLKLSAAAIFLLFLLIY